MPLFPDLHVLRLGSGSGGWNDVYQPKFLNGLFVMNHLRAFSLTYDCNDDIIDMLVRSCAGTLRVLDVEHSAQLTDAAADDIAKLTNLAQLHAFHTGLTPWGHSKILRGLKRLRVLVRGDFLCEALEVICQECSDAGQELPTLELEEFWSSEQYFFHDSEQLQMVNRVSLCPGCHRIKDK